MIVCELGTPKSVHDIANLTAQWMVSMSWQLVVIVAVLTILTWAIRNRCSARFRYAIWLIVPIRLVIPPTLALVVGWGWWCLPSQPSAESVASIESSIAELDSRPEQTSRSQNVDLTFPDSEPELDDRGQRQTTNGLAAVDGVSDHHPKNLFKGSAIEKPLGFPNTTNNGEKPLQQTASSKSGDWKLPTASWPIVFFLVWLVGFGALLLRLCVGILQVRKLVHDSKPAAGSTIESASACRSLVGLRKPVAIMTSLNITTPMLVGVFRPTILLPVDCEQHLDAEELESVLVHEFQHVVRQDPLVHFVTTLISFVYWFHPAVWFTQWRLRQIRELACDEATIATLSNSRKSYASGLVKVAEMISSKQPSPAVGFIERKSEMTNRVMRILDRKTRIGRGVSAFGLIAIVSIGMVLIPGAARPGKSMPSTTSPFPTQTTTEDETAFTTPIAQRQDKEVVANGPPEEIVVKIVDEQGKPLNDVNFYVNAVTRKLGFPSVVNKNYKSNEDGIATLKLPTPLTSVRIWPSKDGYVPLFFNWEDEDLKSMPKTYDLILQKGTELKGMVVDSQGRPVSGAKVDVSLFGGGLKAEQKTRVRNNNWLASEEAKAVTDKNGKWSINNAPKGDLKLKFLIEHPDFVNDTSRRDMGQYGVTIGQLRNGTAKFGLKRGIPISGKITDDKGNPVNNGLVIWGNRPYWQTGSQEIEISESGEFLIPPQPEGSVRITVVAPGWMPTDRVIELSEKVATQDFSLQRGKKLRLKFVDHKGSPIPNVSVRISEWHGKEALFNMSHSNVKDTKIPRSSNDRGIYTWDWAPDDLVKFQFSVRQWRSAKQMDIVPSDEPQTITLRKPFELFGNVVDSKTGEPINNFTIVPVSFRSASNSVRGIAQQAQAETFKSSEFKYGRAFRYDDGRLVALRFQAVGYRDFTTSRFTSDTPTPSLETTIRLEPTTLRSVRVLEPNGKACTDAFVWMAKPDQPAIIDQVGDYFQRSSGGEKVNSKGEVQYGSPSTKHAIVAANRLGYAEKYLEVDEDPGELTLQPWAKLEGILYQEGKPVSGATIIAAPIRELGGSNPHVQDLFRTVSDANGRFVFERLPPVPTVVRSVLSPWQDYPITSSRQVPITLQPGKQHKVSLGGDGLTVKGKIKLVGDNAGQIQFRYGLNNLLKVDGGIQTPKHAFDRIQFEAGAAKEWNEKLEASLDPSVTRESFFVKIRDDGTFIVSGVQMGQYRFLVKLYEPPAGCLIEPVGYGFMEFSTKDFKSRDKSVDLGSMEVKLKSMPKVGDLLPDFRYQDMKGMAHQISAYRGKFVLIDFWASWCQPCIKAFPDLAKINDSIAQRDDAAIVSISVDEDFDAAKTIALREKLTWPVGVAGKSAVEGSAAKVLGVSAVPTYIVLDPNGKIVYRGTVLSEAATYLPNSKE